MIIREQLQVQLAEALCEEEERLAQCVIDNFLPESSVDEILQRVSVKLCGPLKYICVDGAEVLELSPWEADHDGYALEAGFHYRWIEQ